MTRTTLGRTPEGKIAIAALQVCAAQPHGEATTAQLKKFIPDYIKLTEGDLHASPSRPHERKFHQIIGNIISHRESEGNIIAEGYAEYTGSGLKITDSGRSRLKHLGYA